MVSLRTNILKNRGTRIIMINIFTVLKFLKEDDIS